MPGRDRSAATREPTQVLAGGCHCGRVTFEVQGAPERALVCNCSVCTKKGYLHWIVSRERFHLRGGRDALRTYRFHTRTARHHFCAYCGVAPFYVARSDPDAVDVNLHCVEGVETGALPRERFDGRRWEEAYAAYRGGRGHA